MIIKLIEKRDAPFIDNRFFYYNQPRKIKNIDKLKPFVEKGFKFNVMVNESNGTKYIPAEKYFETNEIKKTVAVSGEVEVVDENVKEETTEGKCKLADGLSIDELKEVAKDLEIPSYWVMKEETLREKIESKMNS